MPQFQTLCSTRDIPDGHSKAFAVGDHWIGVFHVDGEFHAIDNRCPHAGASLAHGNIEGSIVRCRIHHWGFCLRDGTYVDEEKPQYNVGTYAVRVVNGEVQVCLES